MLTKKKLYWVDKEARNYFKEKVYQTVIQRNTFSMPSHGLPCVIYDKNYVGSKSYFKLAEELKKSQVENCRYGKRFR